MEGQKGEERGGEKEKGEVALAMDIGVPTIVQWRGFT